MTIAVTASSSIEDWAVAAVRLNFWRPLRFTLRPPTSIDAPRTRSVLPRIEPISDALTTSCSPCPSANSAMISSGALPKVTLSSPPIPGPERFRQLLGRAAHERRGRDHAGCGGEEHEGRLRACPPRGTPRSG